MGLKSDIKKAFLNNLDNSVRDENYEVSSAADVRVDKLAEDISKAIIGWVKAQTFIITSLNATQVNVPVVTPVGPGVAPKVTVKIDENSQAVDNPLSGVESMQSKVQLKKTVEI